VELSFQLLVCVCCESALTAAVCPSRPPQDLKETGLTSSIPTQLGLLTNLKEMQLQNNLLTGEIPSELMHMYEENKLSSDFVMYAKPVWIEHVCNST